MNAKWKIKNNFVKKWCWNIAYDKLMVVFYILDELRECLLFLWKKNGGYMLHMLWNEDDGFDDMYWEKLKNRLTDATENDC